MFAAFIRAPKSLQALLPGVSVCELLSEPSPILLVSAKPVAAASRGSGAEREGSSVNVKAGRENRLPGWKLIPGFVQGKERIFILAEDLRSLWKIKVTSRNRYL